MQTNFNNRNLVSPIAYGKTTPPARKEVALRRMDGTIYVNIHHNPATNRVVSDWVGYYGLDDSFQKGLLAEIRMIEETAATTWMPDLSLLQTSIKAHMDWIVETITPMAVKAGVRAEAVVLPQTSFIKHETKAIIEKIQKEHGGNTIQAGTLTIGFFEDRSKAQAWLDEQVQSWQK